MNSKLFYNENGHITMKSFRSCEEAVSVRFALPDIAAQKAEVYVLAQRTDENASDLRIAAGGREFTFNQPATKYASWLRAPLDATALQAGTNELTLPSQPGWSVAYEPATGHPLVRLRLWHDELSSEPVIPVYGDSAIAANRGEWLALLPESLRTAHNRWEWCWELAGFLSSAWPYANEEDGGTAYAPWDARTILRWGRAGCNDGGEKCIAMCVHYAICFIQFCTAMGIPARSVILTSDVNMPAGHFVAEVWLDEFQSWAMIDPNMQLCYLDPESGRPLSAAELSQLKDEPRAMLQQGPGFKSQEKRLGGYLDAELLTGRVYRQWGVWRRHDWIERPDLAPPEHGAIPYAETDIIWCVENEADQVELGMFPHCLSAAQLGAGPT